MLRGPSKDPGRVVGRVTSVGVLIGAYRRGVQRRLIVSETAPVLARTTSIQRPELAPTPCARICVHRSRTADGCATHEPHRRRC